MFSRYYRMSWFELMFTVCSRKTSHEAMHITGKKETADENQTAPRILRDTILTKQLCREQTGLSSLLKLVIIVHMALSQNHDYMVAGVSLSICHTITSYLFKTVVKKEKILVTCIFSFSINVFFKFTNIQSTLNMSNFSKQLTNIRPHLMF